MAHQLSVILCWAIFSSVQTLQPNRPHKFSGPALWKAFFLVILDIFPVSLSIATLQPTSTKCQGKAEVITRAQ